MRELLFGFCLGVLAVFAAAYALLLRHGGPPPKYEPNKSSYVIETLYERRRRQRRRQEVDDELIADVPEYLTQYQEGHDVETCAWLDIAMHRLFQSFTELVTPMKFENFINARLAELDIPEFVGPIVCQDVKFGRIVPVIKDIKVHDWRHKRPIKLEFNVEYKGDAHLVLESELKLNAFNKNLATCPVELGVSDLEFDFTVLMNVDPSLTDPSLSFSLLPEMYVDFSVSSEIGNKDRKPIREVPHLKDILLKGVIIALRRETVLPKSFDFYFGGQEPLIPRELL